jgi:hypothetical protein
MDGWMAWGEGIGISRGNCLLLYSQAEQKGGKENRDLGKLFRKAGFFSLINISGLHKVIIYMYIWDIYIWLYIYPLVCLCLFVLFLALPMLTYTFD